MNEPLRGLGFQHQTPTRPTSGKTKLLVFAVSTYKHHRYWNNLEYPTKITKDFVQILRSRYGLSEIDILGEYYDEEVTVDRVATEIEHLEYTNEFGLSQINKNDNLIIVFSGHGFYADHQENKIGYWVLHDSGNPNATAPTTDSLQPMSDFFAVEQLVSHVSKTVCRHMLIIIDSCYSSYFTIREIDLPEIIKPGIGPKDIQSPSRWILTSGRGERVPDESEFAFKLNALLRENTNPKIGIHEIYAALRSHLEKLGLPLPFCSDLVAHKWNGGDFNLFLAPDTLEREISNRGLEKDFSFLLKNNSHEYYWQLRNSGRFQHLAIEKTLLPYTELSASENWTTVGPNHISLVQAAAALRRLPNPHGIIHGEGGMGKTVSLVTLWDNILSQSPEIIPLFVPLNEYNQTGENEKSDFILRYIASIYLQEPTPTDAFLEKLWRLFCVQEKSEGPEIVLLLDGYNEVTVEEEGLMIELDKLANEATNCQLLLTSRYLEVKNELWTANATWLTLQPLRHDTIQNYLDRFPEVATPALDVYQLLVNPMMLLLYVETVLAKRGLQTDHNYIFYPETRKGTLLWNFREAMLAKHLLVLKDNEEEKGFMLFLHRLFIPYIGWRMEKMGEFFLVDRPLNPEAVHFSKIINEGCAYFDENAAECIHAFPSFFAAGKLPIGQKVGLDTIDRNRRIRRYLVEKLQVLTLENNAFRFLHQDFRDFFAACHLKNVILISRYSGELPSEWATRKLSWELRTMLGDLEASASHGRHQLSATLIEQTTTLNILLNACRGKEMTRDLTLWNCLHVLEDSRGDLAGLNLENLDLRGIPFNGKKFSRSIGQSIEVAKLKNSRIHGNQFFSESHTKKINSIKFSPDGQTFLTASDDGTIKEWNVAGVCLKTYQGHTNRVHLIVFAPSGESFASVSDDLSIKIWKSTETDSVKTIKLSQIFRPTSFIKKLLGAKQVQKNHLLNRVDCRVTSVAFSNDECFLIFGCNDWLIRIWDISKSEISKTLEGHGDNVTILKTSSVHKNLLVSSGYDNQIILWNQLTWEKDSGFSTINKENAHQDWISDLHLDPSKEKLVTASLDGTVKLWEANLARCERTLSVTQQKEKPIFAIYTYNGKRILVVYQSGLLCEFSASTGVCLKLLFLPKSPIQQCDYSESQQTLIVVFGDMNIAQIAIEKDLMKNSFTASSSSEISSTDIDTQKNTIVVAGQDRTIKEFLLTGFCLNIIQTNGIPATISHNSRIGRVLITTENRRLEQYSIHSGKPVGIQFSKKIQSASYSPDGQKILICSVDGEVIEYSDTPQLLFKHNAVIQASYNDSGTNVLIAPNDLCVIEISLGIENRWRYVLTDANTYRYPETTLFIPTDPNKILVKFDGESTFYSFNTENGKWMDPFTGHRAQINSFAFSPCKNYLLTSSEDHTVKEWALATAICVNTINEQIGPMIGAHYTQDGTQIVAAAKSGTLLVWSRSDKQCIRKIFNIPGLYLNGLDLSQLHTDAKFTEEEKILLKKYGALFDDEDKNRWEASLKYAFGEDKNN